MNRLGIYLALEGLILYFENPVTAEAKVIRDLLEGIRPPAIVRLGEIDTSTVQRTMIFLRETLPPSIKIIPPPSNPEGEL